MSLHVFCTSRNHVELTGTFFLENIVELARTFVFRMTFCNPFSNNSQLLLGGGKSLNLLFSAFCRSLFE